MNFFGLNRWAYFGSVLAATRNATLATFIEDFVVLLILEYIQQSKTARKFKIGNLQNIFHGAILVPNRIVTVPNGGSLVNLT